MKTNLSVIFLLFGLTENTFSVLLDTQFQTTPPKSDSLIKVDKHNPIAIGAHLNESKLKGVKD